MSNLSEEEKKAIEYLKRHIMPVYGRKGNIEYMLNDVLLNLIEKQQKEIEQEKEKNKKLQDKCIELEEENIKIKHLMRNPCDIPRQIIIEKMNKDINTNEHTILGGRRNGKTLEYGIRLGRIQMCEELLQEGDDK